jgi:multidrug efflux pump subunit AcrA (membrane-fusion protein)
VATLDGLVNAGISARVSGYLISQDYKEGTAVKKGDLLFQIDPAIRRGVGSGKSDIGKSAGHAT